jgi:RES domain-containing protein
MLEYFVHIDPDDPPNDLVVVAAEIPNSVSRRSIAVKDLPVNWRASPAPLELAAIGDAFAQAGRASILIVPSALAPTESNWLINPQHSHFARIRLHQAEALEYDPRFFQ